MAGLITYVRGKFSPENEFSVVFSAIDFDLDLFRFTKKHSHSSGIRTRFFGYLRYIAKIFRSPNGKKLNTNPSLLDRTLRVRISPSSY